MTKYGYVPCGKCADNRNLNAVVEVHGMKLYAKVPCPACCKSHYTRAIKAIKKRHGSTKVKRKDD